MAESAKGASLSPNVVVGAARLLQNTRANVKLVHSHDTSASDEPGPTSIAAALRQRKMTRNLTLGAAKMKMPIKLHHSFGTITEFGVVLLQEDVILYPVGRQLVSHNLKTHSMSFLHTFPETVERVSAFALTGNRTYIALCEVMEGTGQSQVRILKLTNRAVTVATLTADVDTPFCGCCFSEDCKYFLAHTGDPDHMVVVWYWVEERPVGLMRLKSKIGRVRFNPGAASLISTSYPLKLARLNDKGHFKGIDMPVLNQCHARGDHCWLSTKVLLVADNNGRFTWIDDSVLVQATTVPDCHTSVVERTSNGFIAGCSDGKTVIFRRPPGKPQYEPNITLSATTPLGGVRYIHVGPDDVTALLICEELCSIPLAELLSQNRSKLEEAHVAEARYSTLCRGAHVGPIIAMSCAQSKPLLVSAGEDLTIRVWDYRRWSCQFVHMLTERVVDLSLHPDGMQLLLALNDRLAIFHVSSSELLSWRDLPLPNLRLVQFSSGGHMFAAATANTILLYSSYSHDLLGTVEGHAMITSLRWGPFDLTIHCGASDGMTYAWRLEGLRRVHEHRTFRGSAVLAMAVTTDTYVARDGVCKLERQAVAIKDAFKEGSKDGERVMQLNCLAISGDSSLKQVAQTSQRDKMDEVSLNERLSILDAMDESKVVVCGSTVGSIFALIQAGVGMRFQKVGQLRPHFGAVTGIAHTADETFIFSGASDGSIFAYRRCNAPRETHMLYSDVQLVSRSAVADAGRALFDADEKYWQLHTSSRAEVAELEAKFQQKIEAHSAEAAQMQLEEDEHVRMLKAEHDTEMSTMQKQFAQVMGKSEESHRRQVSYLEDCIRKEILRFEEVSAELMAVRSEALKRINTTQDQVEQSESERKKQEELYNRRIADMEAEHSRFLQTVERKVEERVRQMEEEQDTLLREERTKYDMQTKELSEERNDLVVRQAVTQQKIDKYWKEREDWLAVKDEQERESQELRQQIVELKATIAKLRTEATHRERVLGDRDKQFVSMRESAQKGDAARTLLEMRIKELLDEHNPVQEQVLELKASVSNLEDALLKEGDRSSKAEEACKVMEARVRTLTHLLKEAQKSAADADTFNRTTLGDLTQIVERATPSWLQLTDYVRKRIERARAIGRMKKDADDNAGDDPDLILELTRQRNRMELTVSRLSSDLKTSNDRSREALLVRGAEASQLIQDKVALQRENVSLKSQLNTVNRQLAKAIKDQEDAVSEAPMSDLNRALSAPGGSSYFPSSPLASGVTEGRPNTAHTWMGEQLEKHAIENQRLRENLLWFTAKSTENSKRKGKRGNNTSTMPLPPV